MKRLTTLAPLVVLVFVSFAVSQKRQEPSVGTDSEPFRIARGSSFSASKRAPTTAEPAAAEKSSSSKILADVTEALDIIQKNHAVGERLDYSSLAKSLLDSALRTLDPHSTYFDSVEFHDLLDEEKSEYSGIGATIVNYRRGGQLDTYVVSTVPGSPAASAKLKFGDRIIKVDDQEMTGRPSDEVRDAVRGQSGLRVRLLVERAATGKIEAVDIRRNLVAQPSVRDAFMLPGGVGYVAMTEGFNYTTAEEFSAALKQLHRLGATGLVIDLRDNPGGILEQAVKVAEKFLPAGDVIVSQRGRSRVDNHVWRSTNRTPETMPVVLLVNENTASASEILAGALQDHDRALIVGQKTFGKGLVQSVFDTPYNSGLTLTTARYFTPSGRLIQRDYSDGNLYDYYNHRTAVQPKNEKEARTAANRPVYGGDGITPDDQIEARSLSKNEQDLLDTLFFFARDAFYKQAPAASVQIAFNKSSADTSGVLVDDKLLAAFAAYAEKISPGLTTSEDFRSEGSFVAERLKYNLTLAAKGEIYANRILLFGDPQIVRALSQLPRAKELASAGSKNRSSAVH
jgi:carboxyl-terminal processing protease